MRLTTDHSLALGDWPWKERGKGTKTTDVWEGTMYLRRQSVIAERLHTDYKPD
jgi:hypothetical protein